MCNVYLGENKSKL